jgi:hypothetical protein
MGTQKPSSLAAYTVLVASLSAAGTVPVSPKGFLVSEISLANATVTETYERVTTAPQLIVTTKMEMGGRDVSVRRVYEAESPR